MGCSSWSESVPPEGWRQSWSGFLPGCRRWGFHPKLSEHPTHPFSPLNPTPPPSTPQENSPDPAGRGREAAGSFDFRTTHWSVVLLAGGGDSPDAADALEALCRTYWYPLYAFVRRKGHSPEDSQDLVQGYFELLLTRRDLMGVHPCKGRFRTFLLTTMGHFLANQWDRARAAKRGGGVEIVSMDSADPEERYRYEPRGEVTPETLFEVAWAARLLDTVLARLRAECTAEGQTERFEALKEFLVGERGALPYATVAERLQMTEQGVKSAIHRLRVRFRAVFREEIARTVGSEDEIDGELRHLVRVMTR